MSASQLPHLTNTKIYGNTLVATISYEKEELFFIKRFIWPMITIYGKDLEIGENNTVSVIFHHPSIIIAKAFKEDVNLKTAHAEHSDLVTSIGSQIDQELKRFWDKRSAWESSFEMAFNAMGLGRCAELETAENDA